MYKKKILPLVLAILIAVSGLGTIHSLSLNNIPPIAAGNADLYNSNAAFLNSNVSGNSVGFTHSAGVLASDNKTAENSCSVFTNITGLTQMINPADKSRANIDTLTYVTKSKLTISDGADAAWKGGSIVLRYDADMKKRLTLRYSPAYNATQGCLRVVGYSATTDYPVTQAVSTNASVVVLTVVQTKTTVTAYLNESYILTYTIPTNSPYLNLPYAFGLSSVNSICSLSETSVYFAERVDFISVPAIPVGNANLYNPNASFSNANINAGGGTTAYFTHQEGSLKSTAKTFENSSALNTAITGFTQVINPLYNSKINIDTLCFVTKTKLTIENMDNTSWYGAGVTLRYDPTTKARILFRYSNEGKIRLVGINGAQTDWLLTLDYTANLRELNLAVVQTKNIIDIYVNNLPVATYTVPDASVYLTVPFSFGLYSVYSVTSLTETNLYFAEKARCVPFMPSGNVTLYNVFSSFTNADVNAGGGTAAYFTHTGGILASASKIFENSSVINTAFSGLTDMINPADNNKIKIDTLTLVTKTKLTIQDVDSTSWFGAGVMLRYDPATKTRLMFRYSQDGKIRLMGINGSQTDWLLTLDYTANLPEMNLTFVQTKNNIDVYNNNLPIATLSVPDASVYLTVPYAFGLYSVYSMSSLTETSMYFGQSAAFIPTMPQGNASLYNSYASFTNANVYAGGNTGAYFTHSGGILRSTAKSFENISTLNTSITGLNEVVNPLDNSKMNIDTLSFVTKTKLTIEDMDSTSWHGAGVLLRYDPVTKARLMFRYSQDGKIRLIGVNGAQTDWLLTLDYFVNLREMNISVVQTKNSVAVYIEGVPVINYTLADTSGYITVPYAFGLYSVYSVSKLSESSLYFIEKASLVAEILQGNENLYSMNSGFDLQRYYNNNDVSFTHSNGVLSSTSKNSENACVLKTEISGKSKMVNPVDDSEVNINTLTNVTRTKLTILDIGTETWHGTGIVLRFNKTNGDRLMFRYTQDGKLRLGAEANWFLTLNYIPSMREMDLTVVQTKNVICIYINNIEVINYTLPDTSVYLETPYALGLYTTYSMSTLTNTSMYFTERVDSMSALSGIGWTIDNNYIKGYPLETTILDVKTRIHGPHISNVDIVNSDNVSVYNSNIIATGMTVKVIDNNNTVYQYKTVMSGDVNGDGRITTLDVNEVRDALLESKSIDGEFKQAADLYQENEITLNDLVDMTGAINGSLVASEPLASDIQYRDNYVSDDQYLVLFLANTTVTQAGNSNKGLDAMENTNYVSELPKIFGDINVSSNRKYAIGFPGPMLLTQSIQQMNNEVNAAFDLAEKYNVPIYFQLDDCNNYTDFFGYAETTKYYNNPLWNEWTAFPTAGETWGNQASGRLPYYWFNWSGSWQHLQAFPCFESPGFKSFVKRQLQLGVMEPLIKRYRSLKANNKEYLFAGIAVGWETHIPDYSAENTYCNINPNDLPTCTNTGDKMQAFEAQKFGYNALKLRGETTYNREVLYDVIHDYSEFLAKTVYDYGIPRRKIFTHMLGTRLRSPGLNTTTVPPISAAVNDYSIPGYSLENSDPRIGLLKSKILEADPTQTHFANAEGYVQTLKNSYLSSKDYFTSMFTNGAYVSAVFGWGYEGPGVPLAASHDPDNPFVMAASDWINGIY